MAYLYLYSVNPLIVFELCMEFYKGRFRVYAAKEFSNSHIPNDSNPKLLYEVYRSIAGGDKNHTRYRGIIRAMEVVAQEKLGAGEISDDEYNKIFDRIGELRKSNNKQAFSPVIFIIDRKMIKASYRDKDRDKNPSEEFVIEKLERHHFEVMSLEDLPNGLSNP